MSTINAATIKTATIQHTNGTTALTIDSVGRVINTNQIAFYACSGEGAYTLTNGADFPLELTRFNRGSHYNTGNYRFTAPVDGIYLFTFTTYPTSQSGRMSFKLNGGTISGQQNEVSAATTYAMVIQLSVNDYVTVGDWQNLSGGQFWRGHTQFSGALLF